MDQINVNKIMQHHQEHKRTTANENLKNDDESVFSDHMYECKCSGPEAEEFCTHDLCKPENDDDLEPENPYECADSYFRNEEDRKAYYDKIDNGGGGLTGSDSGAHFLV